MGNDPSAGPDEIVHAQRSADEFFSCALRAAAMGAWELDLSDLSVRRSIEHDRLFGHEQVLPQWTYDTYLQHVLPEDRHEVDERFRHVMAAGVELDLECRIRRTDSQIRWLWLAGRPGCDRDGRPRIAGIIKDVTERKQAEVALREATARLVETDQRKNRFLASLSHELRNPLMPVQSCLHLLESAPPEGAQARRAKKVMKRQLDQLARLVDDLLDVSRIARGKIHLQRFRLDLNELVRSTLEDHRSLFELSRLNLHFEAAPLEVFVNADWNRMAQVLGNILQNAAKFTPAGGRVVVTVAVDHETEYAVVSVADTGLGLTPESLGTLFQPLDRADDASAHGTRGLGLGLALAKGIIEQHGGTIEAQSAGRGCGAVFTLRCPMDSFEASASERLPVARTVPRRRVLVIEDNQDAAHSLRDVLELSGHEVVVAYSGMDGLNCAREFRPEVILCDIGLPGMDGYAVARALRSDSTLCRSCLVALTGYAQPEDRTRAAEAGFDHHLAKPPKLETLESVLADATSARR